MVASSKVVQDYIGAEFARVCNEAAGVCILGAAGVSRTPYSQYAWSVWEFTPNCTCTGSYWEWNCVQSDTSCSCMAHLALQSRVMLIQHYYTVSTAEATSSYGVYMPRHVVPLKLRTYVRRIATPSFRPSPHPYYRNGSHAATPPSRARTLPARLPRPFAHCYGGVPYGCAWKHLKTPLWIGAKPDSGNKGTGGEFFVRLPLFTPLISCLLFTAFNR